MGVGSDLTLEGCSRQQTGTLVGALPGPSSIRKLTLRSGPTAAVWQSRGCIRTFWSIAMFSRCRRARETPIRICLRSPGGRQCCRRPTRSLLGVPLAGTNCSSAQAEICVHDRVTNERDEAHTSAVSHAQNREPALVVRGVSKSFSGIRVLDAVQLEVGAGQVHALVGHNGSGKSTLIKALAGFHDPDDPVEGLCVGRSFSVGDHLSAAEAGMRFVHQDLGLVDELSTVDNLALGPGFPRRLGGTIRWTEARRRSERIMGALGYDIDVNRPVGALSASERTGVAIARALEGWTGTPALVVLDEPTASMPAPEVDRLFLAIRRLRERGAGILYVSHHLDEVLALADVVTILRGGRVVRCAPASELSHHSLVEAIVGRTVIPAVGGRQGLRSLGCAGTRQWRADQLLHEAR